MNRSFVFRILLFLFIHGLCWTGARAQFIPDPGMRNWLNGLAPGCVDGNGILDPQHPDLLLVEDASIFVNWQDLTGIQYLTNLRRLVMSHGTFPFLPAFPDSLEVLEMFTVPYATLPPLPPKLRVLRASTGYSFQGFQHPFPETLDTLDLSTLSPMNSLQGLNEGLRFLRLSCDSVNGLGPLPSTLQDLLLSTAQLECVPPLPIGLQTFLGGVPNVPCLPNMPAACTFSPFVPTSVCTIVDPCASAFGAITGAIHVDWNGNGVQDDPLFQVPVGHVAAQPGATVSGLDANGRFYLGVDVGTYQVLPTVNLQHMGSVSPASHVTSVNTALAVDSLNDFLVTLLPNVTDLQVEAYVSLSRPGFNTSISFVARNVGSLPVSGSLQFAFDPIQDYQWSVPAADLVQGSSAVWDFTGLQPGHADTWACVLSTPATVAPGTPIQFMAELVTNDPDATPQDNVRTITDVVVAAIDPNDKRVNPDTISPAEVLAGVPLTYTIRYQNTGTTAAERVVITDTLPPGLDVQTFQYIMASHPCTWSIQDGVLHFVHENIMLPDSTSDPEGSQGFVQFRISPVPGLMLGDEVHNVANIYFDFNEPVITEPAVLVVTEALGIEDKEREQLLITPNPVRDRLMLHGAFGAWLQVDVLDGLGRRVTGLVGDVRSGLDVSTLAPGVYQLLATTKDGRRMVATFIRE